MEGTEGWKDTFHSSTLPLLPKSYLRYWLFFCRETKWNDVRRPIIRGTFSALHYISSRFLVISDVFVSTCVASLIRNHRETKWNDVRRPIIKNTISTLIQNSISEKVFPGAVAYILTSERVIYHEAFGFRSVKPKRLPMLRRTLFDLASLTKPIVVGTLCMQLVESGELSLRRPVQEYLPEFRQKGVTLTHLLAHTSGLPAWIPLYLRAESRERVVSYLGQIALASQPGEKTVYSCLGYIVLGKLLERVTGQSLDELSEERIFAPLGMEWTRFNPPQEWHKNCAATEDSNSFERRMVNYERYDWREGVIIGQVHDENAHFLNGISGNAGLFSTSTDLGKFCKALMDSGGNGLLRPESLDTMRQVVSAEGERRCIGWIVTDDDCLYHTGFTGTSIRICLKRKLAAILLTNRVHPDADRRGIIDFRRMFHNIVYTI